MRTGGIVLCGGQSSRMGRAKAWLPFGDEWMLPRVVRILREVVEPVVVVAAPGQDVPPLPAEVKIVRDAIEGQGPLGGLAAGLAALEGRCDAVYLSSCDVPLLRTAFVRRVIEEPTPPAPLAPCEGEPPPGSPCNPLLSGKGESDVSLRSTSEDAPFEPASASERISPFPLGTGAGGVGLFALAAVPRVNGFLHPLAAVYRVEVLPVVRAMLAAGDFRMTNLFARVPTRVIESHELADADPDFTSLRNLNTPEEYEAALKAVPPLRGESSTGM